MPNRVELKMRFCFFFTAQPLPAIGVLLSGWTGGWQELCLGYSSIKVHVYTIIGICTIKHNFVHVTFDTVLGE